MTDASVPDLLARGKAIGHEMSTYHPFGPTTQDCTPKYTVSCSCGYEWKCWDHRQCKEVISYHVHWHEGALTPAPADNAPSEVRDA